MIYGSSNERVRPWINLTETRGILAPTRVRTMTPEECAYIGAMLDAEGCVYYPRQYGEHRGGPQLDFANTMPRLISFILGILGTGTIRTEHKRGERLPCQHIKIYRLADVWNICLQVQDWSFKAQSVVSYLMESYGVKP